MKPKKNAKKIVSKKAPVKPAVKKKAVKTPAAPASSVGQAVAIKGKPITPKSVKDGKVPASVVPSPAALPVGVPKRQSTAEWLAKHGGTDVLGKIKAQEKAREVKEVKAPKTEPKKAAAPRDPEIHKVWERDEDAKGEAWYAYFIELQTQLPSQADVRGFVTFANERYDLRNAKRVDDSEDSAIPGTFRYEFRDLKFKGRKITLIVLE